MPLVANDTVALHVLENLRIDNMTKRPKAKKDAKGRLLPNRAKAKAGLKRAILSSTGGQVVFFTTYKALRLGKLVITVAPEYSSQECAICALTAKNNRLSQAEFVCQRCGTTRLASLPNAVSKNFFPEIR